MRVARGCGMNHGSRVMTFQGTVKHSAEASRVIRSTHNDDRAESLPVAPVGKHRTFVLGSGYRSRDMVDAVDAKRPQLSNGSCGLVFVGDPAAHELAVHHGVRSVGENCDSRGHTAVNKVGGFEHSGAVGTERHDDEVGGFDALIDNERPSSCSQNRSSNGGYTSGSAQQHDHQHDPSPSLPTSDHVPHDI